MMSQKEHLYQLAKKGKIKEAIDELCDIVADNPDSDVKNGAPLLSSRFFNNENDFNSRKITREDYEVKKTNIEDAFYKLIDAITDESFNHGNKENHIDTSKNNTGNGLRKEKPSLVIVVVFSIVLVALITYLITKYNVAFNEKNKPLIFPDSIQKKEPVVPISTIDTPKKRNKEKYIPVVEKNEAVTPIKNESSDKTDQSNQREIELNATTPKSKIFTLTIKKNTKDKLYINNELRGMNEYILKESINEGQQYIIKIGNCPPIKIVGTQDTTIIPCLK